MDPTSQIQTYLIIAFLIFTGFLGIILFLLVNLLSSQHNLKKAQAQLREYSENLEKMVKERTAELRASEEMYRNLFVNSQEAIIVFNRRSGKIVDANSEATTLFGYPKSDLLKKNVKELNIPENPDNNRGEWEGHWIRRNDNSTRFIDCITGEINYGGDECCQVICRDITAKRELESQLIQSQKMGALGQLAAGVAHELNTPLGSIYNSSYFIREELMNQPSSIQKHFDIIENQIERCRKIIKDLLNFSRPPSTTVELMKTNLNNLLERCLSLTEKEIRSNGINLVKDLGNLPLISVDPSRITQVFFNIILNAIQAMPSGGSLTIKSWVDTDMSSFLDIQNETKVVHISFEDTGTGISKKNLTEIFNPFFTTKKKKGGVGLGLSVAYEITKLFNGNILVESQVGTGSRFTVNLPIER